MKKLKQLLAVVFHRRFDTTDPQGRINERTRAIGLTALTAAAARLISGLAPFLTLSVTLEYLGDPVYGLWNSAASFFMFLTYADLGLGNALNTHLSRAYGKDDVPQCRRILSATFVILTAVSALLLVIFFAVFPFVDWNTLMNAADPDSAALCGGVVMAMAVSRIIDIPVRLVQQAQIALQDGYRNNLWQCVGQLASIGAIYLIAGLDLGRLTFLWAVLMITVTTNAVNLAFYYIKQRPEYAPSVKYADLGTVKRMLAGGSGFFVLGLLSSIGLSSDNYIIGKTVGLDSVPIYALLLKASLLIGTVCGMVCVPLWGVNGEALSRGDYAWVRKNTRYVSLLCLGLSGFASLCLILFARPALRLLTGNVYEYSLMLPAGLCLLQILLSSISPWFMVLNASGAVKIQIALFLLYTPLSIALKFLLIPRAGITAAAWIGALLYGILIVPAVYIKARRILREGPGGKT